DHLPVHLEVTEFRIAPHRIEHLVHHADEPEAEALERLVPLAVPVRTDDVMSRAFHRMQNSLVSAGRPNACGAAVTIPPAPTENWRCRYGMIPRRAPRPCRHGGARGGSADAAVCPSTAPASSCRGTRRSAQHTSCLSRRR